MKEQVIQIPDSLEIKEIKDGKIILIEKEKRLTYENVADKLFPDKESHYYIDNCGDIFKGMNAPSNYKLPNNALSKKQLEKLLSINKLMNVAKCLNDGWKPNWDNEDDLKWMIIAVPYGLILDFKTKANTCFVYFKSKELAKKAIEILGEKTIKLALCTDY